MIGSQLRSISMDNVSFRENVYKLMGRLPDDRVTTYGDLAAWAGSPRAARIVGGICHYGPTELPWHRVVNRLGGVARGFPGGPEVQIQLLTQDGVECQDGKVVNFEELRWQIGQ